MENPWMKKPNDHAEPTKVERQKINLKIVFTSQKSNEVYITCYHPFVLVFIHSENVKAF